MINNSHPKRLRFLFQIAANPAHTQNTEYLTLGIMPQRRRWITTPFPLSKRLHARIEVTDCADDEEHVYVGGGVVDGRGHVADANGW